jgi:hypothetical protein
MADEIIIETTSAEVIEVGTPGPQGPAGAAGTGLETLTTQGDTLYRGAATGERLPIGTAGQVLKVSAQGVPAWANESGAVTSVNGNTGAVTITPASIDAANANHGHQPTAIYCDAVDVSDTTLSGGEPNGIYFRDGSDNGKAIYKSAQGYALYWDDGEEEWVLGNLSQSQKYYISAGDTTYPWQATSWVLGPQGSGDTPVVDQALLSNYQRNAAQDSVSTRTPKTGNASSTEVVLGNDTRLTNARTPSSTLAHAASHATGIKASFNDQVAGMSTNVFIRAINVGTAGNSITLAFDGVDDIDTVLAAWNAANTSNTAEVVSGDGAQVPDNLEEITLSGGVAAGSDPLSFREISVTDPVSEETYTLKSGVPTTAAGNTGFGIYSESSASFPFITSPSGEVIFAGNSAFLGVADRSDAADRTLDKGLYGLSGCLNVYSQSLASNTISFGDNGDVLVGETGYGVPAVVDGVSSWGAKFQVNGNVAIQDNENEVKATFDAQGKLTANRTYDLPDASGTLALTTTAPASHAHGNLTNDGKVGSTSGLPLVTTTAGAVTTLALGTAGLGTGRSFTATAAAK